MNFEVVIGIEIHSELKTKSKMFSGAPVTFGLAPNTAANEVDLGFPGTMPQLNKQAVALAIRMTTLLNCEIDPYVQFDRKNYYYSDLPKGFQITQDRFPIGKNGHVDVEVDGVLTPVRIERLHMEEDTAKQLHGTTSSLLDYNRAGIPLIEIVTDASIRSGAQAAAYVEKIRSLLLYSEVSDARMDEGSMRCDVNISLRPYGYPGYGNKVEVKNLNSVANVQRAIEYEISRQERMLLQNEVIEQETRRFDEQTKTTVSMRKKEGAIDYQYFTEPNIWPISLDPNWIKDIQASIPEMPDAKCMRYVAAGISDVDARVLVQDVAIASFFDQVLLHVSDPKVACNILLSEVLGYLNKEGLSIQQTKVTAKMFSSMVMMQINQEISSKHVKKILEIMFKTGESPEDIASSQNMKQISDPNLLLPIIQHIVAENEETVTNYLNGRTNLLGYLVGLVIKETKGQANPGLVNQLMKEAIEQQK